MNISEIAISDLHPYENNPRNNNAAVKPVMESIKQFGFKIPIVIDSNNTIICGHTRYEAAKRLKIKTLPCVIADDLSETQIKAFRLADNKTTEFAEWDDELLDIELETLQGLEGIDLEPFGFESNDLYIDNLLKQRLATSTSNNKETFDVTFTFDVKYQELLLEYIKDYTKKPLVEAILTKIGGDV